MIDVIFGDVLYSNNLDLDTQAIVKNMREPLKAQINKDTKHKESALYVLEEKQHKQLKSIINAEIKNYANNIMKYDADFLITTSWFTETDIMEQSQYHQHQNSFISGVLYLNVNEDSGSITFEDFRDEQIKVSCTEYNVLNGNSYTVQPVNGLILLFPSKMWHIVNKNKSEHKRNSLAFNVMPVGTVGVPTADSHMRIKLI